ncbi:MAG: metalloregulator ArsR/SmtB family transcription factor [Chitinophagales bacterium]
MTRTAKEILSIKNPETNKEIQLNYLVLKRAVLTLRAINHPLRKEILELLDEKDKMTVTEIHNKLRLEQSVASQHLAILRKAGVLITMRDGKFIYYKLNHARIQEISSLVEQLAQ